MRAAPLVSEDPLSAWLEMVEARRGPALPGETVFLLVSLLALAPAGLMLSLIGMSWLTWALGSPTPEFLVDPLGRLQGALGLGAPGALFFALLLVPAVQAGLDARLLRSLHQGRTLEDLLGSPLTPAAIADSLARHAFLRTVRLLLAPVALLAVLIVLAGKEARPWEWALLPLGMAPSFFYSLLAGSAWRRSGEGAAVALATGLLVGLPLVVLMAGTTVVAAGFGIPAGLAGGLGVSALLAPFHRFLALQGLESGSALRRLQGRLAGKPSRRSRSLRGGPENAVLFREEARGGARPGRRFLGGLQVGLVAFLVARGLGDGPEDALYFYPLALALLACVSVARALHGVSTGLYAERQQGTLDLLVQSGLSVGEFVAGCVRAQARQGFREFLGGAAALGVATALLGPVQALPGLLAVAACGLAAVESAAVWGAALAADCRQRPQPVMVLLTWGFGAGLAIAFATMAVMVVGVAASWALGVETPQPWHAGLVLLGILAGLASQRAVAWKSALHTLTQRGHRIGFVA